MHRQYPFTVVLGLISFVVILFSSNGQLLGSYLQPAGRSGFCKTHPRAGGEFLRRIH